MSDFARLEQVLAKLRQRERAPGEGRKLSGTDGAARLAALVTEIDETILPRRLSIGLGGAGALHLAVANRRLQALLGPAPDGVPPEMEGRKLADTNDPAVAELGAALGQVLGAPDLAPISTARLETPFPSDVGIPAPQLARTWGTAGVSDAAAADPGALLGGFLESVAGDVSAWLRIEGEDVTGENGETEGMSDLAAVFLDSYFSRFDMAYPEPAFALATVIAPRDAGGRAVLFVEVGDVSAVILAPSGKMPGLAARWQRLVAG